MRLFPRSRPLLAIVVLANIGIVWWAIHRYRPPDPAMESLAKFVLQTGKAVELHKDELKFFRLPDDDAKFYQAAVVTDTGKRRGLQVRYRKSGELDIFFTYEQSEGASFFFTDRRGQLIRAAYLTTDLRPLPGAEQAYWREVEFWKL